MLNTSKNDVPLYSQGKKECLTHEKTSPLLCQREEAHHINCQPHCSAQSKKREICAGDDDDGERKRTSSSKKMRGRRRRHSGCVESI